MNWTAFYLSDVNCEEFRNSSEIDVVSEISLFSYTIRAVGMFLLIGFKLCFKMIVFLSLTCLMVSNLFVFCRWLHSLPLPNRKKSGIQTSFKIQGLWFSIGNYIFGLHVKLNVQDMQLRTPIANFSLVVRLLLLHVTVPKINDNLTIFLWRLKLLVTWINLKSSLTYSHPFSANPFVNKHFFLASKIVENMNRTGD